MEEISNKSLAILLVVAIVVSVAGTFMSLNRLNQGTQVVVNSPTGFATTSTVTGTTNLSIETNAELTFTVTNINFGAGYVNASFDHCNMTSNNADDANTHYAGCINFTGTSLDTPLVLENTGNKDLSLSLVSDKNATTFIGGGAGAIPDPEFKWKLTAVNADTTRGAKTDSNIDTSASCGGSWADSTYTSVNITGTGTCECGDCSSTHSFLSDNTQDEVYIDFYLRIPSDATTSGESTATITALGTY